MKPISGAAMGKLLAANGWQLQRIRGSHHIYSKAGERAIISVPVHGNDMLKPGLAARIARQAKVNW